MKSFNFLRGLSSSPPVQSVTKTSYRSDEGVGIAIDFMKAVSGGQFEEAVALLSPDFRAHEPAKNTVFTGEELLNNWRSASRCLVHHRFDLKRTATFSVFGEIDRDKYIYIKGDWVTSKNLSHEQKIIPFEMIFRLNQHKMAHLLFCFDESKAFDKLSSVQHARLLSRSC